MRYDRPPTARRNPSGGGGRNGWFSKLVHLAQRLSLPVLIGSSPPSSGNDFLLLHLILRKRQSLNEWREISVWSIAVLYKYAAPEQYVMSMQVASASSSRVATALSPPVFVAEFFFQGGGRKGLPKSFLNRFTKVYIDELVEEGYPFICSLLYPSIPHPLLSNLIPFNRRLHEDTMLYHKFAQNCSLSHELKKLLICQRVLHHHAYYYAGYVPPLSCHI
ncbi:hypothetical protein COLO4_09445 [Corchorus olitorius]|uniref:Uncharacterized protein n=1 Tax=Corchorus olitorius TaxID=93759 RepID=A0A1R3KC05_9ROSI|nr:hypothetical protein COLO4_09445 [Corchorus olitorius]